MLDVFTKMRVLDTTMKNGQIINNDGTQILKFLNEWRVTISAVLQLLDDIDKKTPDSVLCMHKLNPWGKCNGTA